MGMRLGSVCGIISAVLAFVTTPATSAGAPAAGPEFRVSFSQELRGEAATGRLVVWLVKVNSPIDMSGQAPADGPFFEAPQPMFGVDVKNLKPGASAAVDDRATGFPGKLSDLAPGRYKAQAVLDVNRLDSSWRREPGNLFSKVQMIEVKPGVSETIEIKLTEVVKPESNAAPKGLEYVEVQSELLTKFRGYPVMLKAGVVLPTGYEGSGARKYAAVYEIPGFSGDHRGARQMAGARRGPFSSVLQEAFWITLNPEGPNGHHLFANSANNGPVGDALVKELIPALEKKYRLIAEPSARLLRGHSSGGWSSIWLALNYPEAFGAAWASSPDPVDFAHFQLPNIYTDAGMYTRGAPTSAPAASGAGETPSYRDTGDTRMTIRQENRMEEVLGPNNTSGQQWDSWMATFGPRAANGDPAALYDPTTGTLDHRVAESFRRYDATDLLRKDATKYAPIFKQRIRLICGGEDNYYLNEAVESLERELAKARGLRLPEGEHGYVKVVPERDHGTIFATEEMRAIPAEMIEHLRRHGHAKK